MAQFSKKQPLINRAIFLSIEKIQNGFIICEPAGQKTWKASINGVVRHLEQAFGVTMVEIENSPKTETTVETVLKTENVITQAQPKK